MFLLDDDKNVFPNSFQAGWRLTDVLNFGRNNSHSLLIEGDIVVLGRQVPYGWKQPHMGNFWEVIVFEF